MLLTSAKNKKLTTSSHWDDVNNCKLDPARVREARKADMEYLQKMQVYKKVSVQKCKDVTGKIPIKARWIDTNKHDEVNPQVPPSACRKRAQAVQ